MSQYQAQKSHTRAVADALISCRQEALEAASQAGSAEAGARQLTLAIAEALGAVPSGGDAAAALAGVQARAQRRIADATVTARLATTKVTLTSLKHRR